MRKNEPDKKDPIHEKDKNIYPYGYSYILEIELAKFCQFKVVGRRQPIKVYQPLWLM